MSEIFSPSRPIRTPTSAEMRIGRPVLGRTTTTLFSGMTGLHGSRLKRSLCAQNVMAVTSHDTGTASTLRYDYRYRWTTSPYATHLWVGIWLVAESGQSTPPQVEAEIFDGGGGLIDAGVTWTAADGSLPLAPALRRLVLIGERATLGVLAQQDDFIETGWLRQTEVAGGPRLLQLGDPGTLHELRLSPLGTRIYSVSAFEADLGRIPGP